MAKSGTKKSNLKSPHNKKEREILRALETAARKSGLKVSSGQLRFAGLKLRSGSCVLHDKQWLILDKGLPFDDLVDIYREALSSEKLIDCGLDKDMLELLRPYLTKSAAAKAGEAA